MTQYPTARAIMNELRKKDQEAKLYVQLGHRTWGLGWAMEENPISIHAQDLVLTVDSDLTYERPVEAGVNLLEQTLYKSGPGQYRGAKLWFTHQGNHYRVYRLAVQPGRVTILAEPPRV